MIPCGKAKLSDIGTGTTLSGTQAGVVVVVFACRRWWQRHVWLVAYERSYEIHKCSESIKLIKGTFGVTTKTTMMMMWCRTRLRDFAPKLIEFIKHWVEIELTGCWNGSRGACLFEIFGILDKSWVCLKVVAGSHLFIVILKRKTSI